MTVFPLSRHIPVLLVQSLAALLTLVLLSLDVAPAQIPTVLQRNGLKGPVRAITYNYTSSRWKDGRWEESDYVITKHAKYDSHGECQEPCTGPYLHSRSGWRAIGFPRPPATSMPNSHYELIRLTDDGGVEPETREEFRRKIFYTKR